MKAQLIYKGSYISGRVLSKLLNELLKSDKMRCLPRILSSFCNEFYKFNKTRARMLDSITYVFYINCNHVFMGKRKYFAIYTCLFVCLI